MKAHLLIFLILLISSSPAIAQSVPKPGQLKVTIESVKCIRKSWDGFIEFDGHGNEIMIHFASRIYDPANIAAAKASAGATPVFGSNVNGQIKSGSQTSDLGGIADGDLVMINRTVLNEHVNANDIIILAPTLWEIDDNNQTTINNFNSQLANDLNWAISQPYPFSNYVRTSYFDMQRLLNDRVIKIFDKYRYGQALKYHTITQHLFNPNAQGNRPIGFITGTYNNEFLCIYPPRLVVLDTRILDDIATNNYYSTLSGTSHAEKESRTTFINGATVRLEERTYGIETSNGIFDLNLKIEFTPDREPPIISSPFRVKEGIGSKNINISNTNLAVTGRWFGTQKNNGFSQAISFELTPNGEYLIKDMQGNIAARGSYTFQKNSLAGSYQLFASSETFSFSAVFDPVTQKLSGSLGSGTNTSNQGTWEVVRK